MSKKERQNKPIFNVGDVVYDVVNRDVGVLLRRYNIFEEEWRDEYEDCGIVIVWDLYWTGPNLLPAHDRMQTYTEEGLEIMFDSGALLLYKSI